MDAGQLHKLAKLLREVALRATADDGDPAVSPGVIAVTEHLSRNPGTSVAETARVTGIAQSQVSTIVAALREHGIVEAEPDPADRRRTLLRIAPAAREHLLLPRGRRAIGPALAERAGTRAKARRVERLLEQLAVELLP